MPDFQIPEALLEKTKSGLNHYQVVRIIRCVEDYIDLNFPQFKGRACSQTAVFVAEALRAEGLSPTLYGGKMAILEAYASKENDPMASWTGHFNPDSFHAWVVLGEEIIDITTPTLADQPTFGFRILDIPYIWYDTSKGNAALFWYFIHNELKLKSEEQFLVDSFRSFYESYERDPSKIIAPRSYVMWDIDAFYEQSHRPGSWSSIALNFKHKYRESYPPLLQGLINLCSGPSK